MLPCNNARNLCVEFCNIDHLAGILTHHIAGYGDVLVIIGNGFIIYQLGKIFCVFTRDKRFQNFSAIYFA